MNIGVDIRPLMSKVRTGVGEYTCELLNAVFEIDKNNQYFLFYNSYNDVSDWIPKWRMDNVKIISTRWPNKLFNGLSMCLEQPKLDKLLGHKIDLFYSPNLNFTAVSKNCKLVLTVHDISFTLFPEFFTLKQRLWHKVIRPKNQFLRADMVVVPSANTMRDLSDYYGVNPEKIKVIYPGLSLQKNENNVSEKYNLPQKYFLFLGTIEPRKNITGIIDAFEKCYSSLKDPYTLVIAGADGWKNKDIYQRIAASPIGEKIKIIGYIPPEEKYSLYSKSDIFIYPSFYEGFGFPVLEAMSAGVPVITSNRSSLPEIGGQAVYYINPNNPLSISEGMMRIANNEKISQYYRSKGLIQAEKFKWQNAAAQWLNIINQI
jgi:glycosyltransferase involved in cell wall biosynthesis